MAGTEVKGAPDKEIFLLSLLLPRKSSNYSDGGRL